MGEGATPFPRLLHFTLDTYLNWYVLSKEVSSTILKVFGMTRSEIEPQSSGPLANTLLTRPMSRYLLRIIHMKIESSIPIEYTYFSNKPIWPLIGFINPGQSGPGSNGSEGVLIIRYSLMSYQDIPFLALVSWGSRIHQLHLCRGITQPQWEFWIWH